VSIDRVDGGAAMTGASEFGHSILRYSAQDVRMRATQRLSLDLPAGALDPGQRPRRGDHILNPDLYREGLAAIAKPAAVLVPIVARDASATLLLTKRASALRRHAGQVAFPGGRIDPEDESPLAAALREANEEIGLDRSCVTPLGFLDPYLSHSGYRILPLVAFVTPPFALVPNPDEVDEAFEVPLEFLMEPSNHQQHTRTREGVSRIFYAMPFEQRNIWGVTAGILHNLYERLYS
jgi:8-oxo-dGTP pyrophosphatase MutT (NUDIX family)